MRLPWVSRKTMQKELDTANDRAWRNEKEAENRHRKEMQQALRAAESLLSIHVERDRTFGMFRLRVDIDGRMMQQAFEWGNDEALFEHIGHMYSHKIVDAIKQGNRWRTYSVRTGADWLLPRPKQP